MKNLIVNGKNIEIDDVNNLEDAVGEILKDIRFVKLTRKKKDFLMYLKNEKFVKREDLNKHEVKDGDNISILTIISGG